MAMNRKQRRLIDEIPEHKIRDLENIGGDLDDLIDQLQDLQGIDLDVDEIMAKAQKLRKQRTGILKLRQRGK